MLGEAIEYPLEGDDTLETLLVGGTLYLLSPFVVPGILLGGYSVAVVRAVLAGRSEPPAFDDWPAYVRDGLSVLAITIVYVLPGLVVAGIGLGVFVLATLLGAADGGAVGAVIVLLLGVGTVAGFAYALVVAYVLPASIVNFARTGELGDAWDVDTLRTVVTDGEFATAWVLAGLLLLVANSVGGTLTVFLIGFVVLFYGQVAAMYLYARGTMDALNVSPEPSTPPTSSGADARDEPDASDAGASPDSTAHRDAPDGADAGETSEHEGSVGSEGAMEAGKSDGTANDGAGKEAGDDRSLGAVDGVGPATAESLRAAGYGTVADLRAATREDLTEVDGVGPAKADRIKRHVGDA